MRSTLLAFVLLGCASRTQPAAPPPTAEQPVSSVDARVQKIAREELDAAVAKWSPSAAVAIVLDATSGAILAAEGRDGTRNDPSIATTRTFVTGSTLKTIVIAAALDEGTITPGTTVDCATRKYGTEELHDASPHGTLSIPEVLAVSSNVGASRIYDTLGLERLNAWFRRFHFDDAPSHLPEVTDGASARAAAYAAGELAETTPMQMSAAYVPFANGGHYIVPTSSGAPNKPVRVLRDETVAAVVKMLEGAVASEIGTGKLARIEGHRVAGKTGTGDHHGKYYGSFVGTVLDAKAPFVILVGFELPQTGGYTGGSAAAPTFARIAQRLIE